MQKKKDLIEPAGFGKIELVCMCDKQLNYFIFFVPLALRQLLRINSLQMALCARTFLLEGQC